MEWKRQDTSNNIASTNSYRKEKLLEFFSTYNTTDAIFVFLRLLVAIHICSHSDQYEVLIPELNESNSLKDVII
jgi:ubiquitin thioesterase protein OTUB1